MLLTAKSVAHQNTTSIVSLQMKIWLLLSSALLLIACSDTERVEKRNEAGVVIERYNRSKTDSLWQGKYEAFDDEGQVVERANYAAGKLDGKRTLYHPNGQVQYEEMHVGGKFDGPYKAYYPDGQLELEGKFIDDKASGVWTGYYPDGSKKEEVTFVDNKENGPFREWYSNGTIKAEGSYLDGDNEQGELVLYDLQGEVQKRMHCEAGVCRTVWQAQTGAANDM